MREGHSVAAKRRKSVPLVGPKGPLVSGRVPLVSNSPSMTIVRHWGLLPSWKRVQLAGRRRDVAPREFALLHFIATAPIHPLRIVSAIATAVKEQAEEETDIGSQLQPRLVELQMRHEAGEIDDNEFAAQERKLQDMLNRLEQGTATKEETGR